MKNEQTIAIIKDIANKHITPAEQRAIEKAIDLVSSYTGLGDEVDWMIDLADNEDGKIIQ